MHTWRDYGLPWIILMPTLWLRRCMRISYGHKKATFQAISKVYKDRDTVP